MATVQLKLGPADHGRELDLGEYEAADYEPGYKYEIVDGRLYVSPEANFAEHLLERWLDRKLSRYSEDHPEVINWVAVKSRVFVHKRQKATVPEPDLAAYQGLDLGPVLVAEVLVEGDEYKDLERNVGLYFDVPSVKEYWVLDGRDDPNRPSLVQHRRYGGRWVVRTHAAGSTFATKLLPGFALVLDPRA